MNKLILSLCMLPLSLALLANNRLTDTEISELFEKEVIVPVGKAMVGFYEYCVKEEYNTCKKIQPWFFRRLTLKNIIKKRAASYIAQNATTMSYDLKLDDSICKALLTAYDTSGKDCLFDEGTKHNTYYEKLGYTVYPETVGKNMYRYAFSKFEEKYGVTESEAWKSLCQQKDPLLQKASRTFEKKDYFDRKWDSVFIVHEKRHAYFVKEAKQEAQQELIDMQKKHSFFYKLMGYFSEKVQT